MSQQNGKAHTILMAGGIVIRDGWDDESFLSVSAGEDEGIILTAYSEKHGTYIEVPMTERMLDKFDRTVTAFLHPTQE
jgi:hypothetical protein